MKIRIFIGVMVLLSFLSGCAMKGYQGVTTGAYPAVKQIFDLTFGWKKVIGERGMTIEGYARNNRYLIIRDLELRIALVTVDGREKARETFLFVPGDLGQGETAPFVVSLKARPQAGERVRFTYNYRFSEGGDHSDGDGEFWMNSFEVDALK